MNKIKKIGISAIGGLVILGTSVFASTGKVNNTSQGLVLRGSASKSGAPLGTIAEGTEVEIIEKTGEWYKVKVNGNEGYLFAEYVKVQETAETVKPETENNGENLEKPEENTTKNKLKIETKMYIMPMITSSVISTIPKDTEIKVEKTLNEWAYVSNGKTKGWIRTYSFNSEALPTNSEPDTSEEKKPTTTENTNLSFTKGYINVDSANVRKGPSKSDSIITTLILNTSVKITAQTDEWYKITYGDYTGYIFKTLILKPTTTTSRGSEVRVPDKGNTVTEKPAEKPVEKPAEKPVEKPAEKPVAPPTTPSTSNGEKIVAFAKQYLGYSYVYGGTTPSGGFDCSGFIYYVFRSCGYNISRSCSVQATSGTAVSRANLQLGDVIFFNNTSSGAIGHVGIYIGNGRFIHAANSKRGVVTDTINSGYYNTYYYSARRIAK